MAAKFIAVIVAAIAVCSLGVHFYFFVCSMRRDRSRKHLIALLYGWQVQIGAALAVAAAFMGAMTVLYQVHETDRLEAERRQRRADALWAVLPLVLADLTRYAENSAKILVELIGTPARSPHEIDAILREQLKDRIFPPLPVGLVGHLTDLIETTDASKDTQPLRILVRVLHDQEVLELRRQVKARRGFLPMTTDPALAAPGDAMTLVFSGAIAAAEIYARCDKLLDYTPDKTPLSAVAISPDDIVRALPKMPYELPIQDLKRAIERLTEAIRQRAREDKNWPEN